MMLFDEGSYAPHEERYRSIPAITRIYIATRKTPVHAATIHILRFPIATRIPTNIANLTIYVLILTYSDAVDSESSARCTVPLNTRSIESMSYYLVGATSLLQALPS